MQTYITLNTGRSAVRLALAVGVILLLTSALPGAARSARPAAAHPGIRYVDATAGSDDSDCSNPADPCASLPHALDIAIDGDEIRVAKGTYHGTVVIAEAVSLRGGYTAGSWARRIVPADTVIDAGGNGQGVIFLAGSDGAVLEGFTITGGRTDPGGDGGGITIRPDTGVVTISHCIIRDNKSGGVGGGIAVAPGSTPMIVASKIINNEATLEWGGGLAAHGNAAPTLVNVLVAGNSAPPGAAGGLELKNGTLMNVTVADNTTAGLSTIQSADMGAVVVTNSILYFNDGDDIRGNAYVISYSDVGEGVLPGTGNISADPQFVDAAGGDYHLAAGSPAIDAGTNVGAPPTDWEGNLRPIDGDKNGTAVADMGADEFLPYRIFLPTAVRSFAS
jgi:hypothetical protein